VRKHSGDPVVTDWTGAGITDLNKYGQAWVAGGAGVESLADDELAQYDHRSADWLSGCLVGENQCRAVGNMLTAFLFPHELEGCSNRQAERKADAVEQGAWCLVGVGVAEPF
jgi:hypothetical protein